MSTQFFEPRIEQPDVHWARLAVESNKVRYYDIAAEINEICLRKSIELLSVRGRIEALEPTNTLSQLRSSYSLWLVFHVFEADVRHAGKEGWGYM